MYNLLEYSSNYCDMIGNLWFYSKDEAINFNADFVDGKAFQSFIGEKIADISNGILRKAIIAISLKYLSNFWRSLEMPLINCKVELKLNWTNHCVLSAAGADNADANSNNIIFTIKDTKFLAKDLKDQCTGTNINNK